MNPRRLVLLATLVGCLVLGGSVAWAGEVSVATLIGNLKSPDESVRLQAIDQLGAQGAKAAEAVAPLSELLKDELGEGPGPRRLCAGRDRRRGQAGRSRPGRIVERPRRNGPPTGCQSGDEDSPRPASHRAAVRQAVGGFGPRRADARF